MSIIYVFLNKPSLVLSAGGFTSVPIILVANFLKIIGVINCKIVIHQQDPKVGLSNRITAKYADLLSCTFEYTKNNYSQFSDSLIIPNPLDISKFANKKFENNNLENFLKSSTKPVLFVFGGGSGAMKINSWINKNLKQITKNFSVVHLTGVLQKKSDPINNLNDYFSLISLDEDMGIMMKKADIVLCRAGLGSISELLYLNKKAFLVPINKSHQEQNANQVKESFYILDESEMSNWLSYILRQYNNGFHDKKFPSSASIERDLQAYYKKVNELDKKNNKTDCRGRLQIEITRKIGLFIKLGV
ncbi:hypothetical protein HC766_00945 [Candidatus Gracilibacteria bacterium]|nr:hypothetical protein [Candidatus Gracilibacteria bacterium]